MLSKEGDVNLPYQREDLWQHGHLGDGQWLQEMLELRSCCLEFEKYKSCWCHYCSDLADLTFPCLFQITPFKVEWERERDSPGVTFLSLVFHPLTNHWASQVALVVKNPPASAGGIRDTSSIPGGGNGSPLQYSCPENPMDRGAMGSWWAMVRGVTKSQTQLKQLSTAHNQLLTPL